MEKASKTMTATTDSPYYNPSERFGRLEIDSHKGYGVLRPNRTPVERPLYGGPFPARPTAEVAEMREFIEERRAEKKQAQIRKWRSGITGTLFLSGVVLMAYLFMAAASLPETSKSLTVASVTGHVYLMQNGKKTPLHTGDQVTATNKPVILTGKGANVTLTGAETRLRLSENAALTVRELAYKKGTVRRFALNRGRLVASTAEPYRAGSIFEVTAGTTRTRLASSSVWSSSIFTIARDQGKVYIATDHGQVVTTNGTKKQEVYEGQQIKVEGKTFSKPAFLKDYEQVSLRESAQKLGSTSFPVIALSTLTGRFAAPLLGK